LSLDKPIGDKDGYSLIDQISAAPRNEDYDRLEELAKQDVTGKLYTTVMLHYPNVNCQIILSMSLQNMSKKEIAIQLGVPPTAFYSFFDRTFIPLLRKLWD
jgi:hypothetical protein